MADETRVTNDSEMETGTEAITVPCGNRGDAGWGRRLIKQFAQCICVAAAAYGCFQFCSHYLFQAVQVDGWSMAPTMADADRYLLNRWIYHVREPRPEDVVVLRDPVDDVYLVKRIVAIPGDLVYLKGGRIFVNRKPLKEAYLPLGTQTFSDPHYREQLWICGVNQYFVLGDNRNNSADSRIFGTVPQRSILGLIMFGPGDQPAGRPSPL